MKKKVSYEPSFNFHVQPAINVMVDTDNTVEWESGEVYVISPRQAARIEKHFCGMSDCRCNGGQLVQLNESGSDFGIYKSFCE